MQVHASCAARDGAGVLLIGPPGAGKSDLLLRLLDYGFALVADDQVVIEGGEARAPERLAGLLEVRSLGIVRLPFARSTRLVLVVLLEAGVRMPGPEEHLGLPVVRIDPLSASAAARVRMAWRCAIGQVTQVAGAFA